MQVHQLLKNMSDPEKIALRDLLRKSLSGELGFVSPNGTIVAKDVTNNAGITTGMNLLGYPLEAPAKLLYAVPTPLRNWIPRETVGGHTFHYRSITGINTLKVWGGAAEATSTTTGRNTAIKYNEADSDVTFKTVRMENMITDEAMLTDTAKLVPGQDFNALDLQILSLLQATMIAEELMLLGGNVTALGAGPTVSTSGVTQPATGTGSLTAATAYYVHVSALTMQGYYQAAGGQVSGTDATGETHTTETTITTAAGGAAGDTSFTVKWTPKRGAVAYNVFVGSTTGAANAKYHSQVTTNRVTVTAVPGSGNRPNAADQTAQATDFDGVIAMAEATTSGYYLNNDNAVLTTDGAGGVLEFDTLFKSIWDTYRTGPEVLIMHSTEKRKADSLMTATSGGYPLHTVVLQQGDVEAIGQRGFSGMMNRYTGTVVKFMIHPNLPQGTVIALGSNLGPYYAASNVASNLAVKLGWDYRALPFARVAAKTEQGMDLHGALICYGRFQLGSLSCVGAA